MLKLYNTLTNTKEEFQPLEEGVVRMYTCGPTVYDYAHIGNFRTFVFQDLLRRYLHYGGYRVIHVMNITDVDDRIIQNAHEQGVSRQSTPRSTLRLFSRTARPCTSSCPRSCRAPPTTSRIWSI